MQWKTAFIMALAVVLIAGAMPVLGQPAETNLTRQPPEAEIRIELAAGGAPTGPDQVLKRYVCPDPACRYSTNIWGQAGQVGTGRCPDPWGIHGGLGPTLVDVGTSADRFVYSHESPTGMAWSRPFHPNSSGNWDPSNGGVDGVDRVRFSANWGKPTALIIPVPDKLRFRVRPPGVTKPAAMAWIPPGGAGEDAYFTDLQSTIGGPSVDLDTPADGIPNNPILANPATCPTQRWVIRVCDEPGGTTPGVVDGGDRFRLFRDSPSTVWPPAEDWRTDQDNTGGVDGDLVGNAVGTTFTSRSEEIAFEFAATFTNGSVPIPANGAGPGGLDALDIVFYTYSNCVYLPYPQANDWDPYIARPAGGWQGRPNAVLTDESTSQQGNAFEYHIRPGEVGVGRIDVQERVALQQLLGSVDRYWWRPYRPRSLAQLLHRPPGNNPQNFRAPIVPDDSNDIDNDSETTDYLDRSLHSYFFSSRLRITAGATDPFDPFMPMVILTGLPGATTPPVNLTVTNRIDAPVLRCPYCGAVHPLSNETDHPQSPIPDGTAAGNVPHVDHSGGGGGAWGGAFANRCEFCGSTLSPSDEEPAGAAVDYSELRPLRTYTSGATDWDPAAVGFSRITGAEDAARPQISFDDVVFTRALLSGTTLFQTLPAGTAGAGSLGVRVPNYQPPSIDGAGGNHPYQGLMVLFRPRDPAHQWFRDAGTGPVPGYDLVQSVTGDALGGGGGLISRSDLLYGDDGQWSTYYVCPDCGAKQSLLGFDLNTDGDQDDPGEHECRNEATGAAGTPPQCEGHAFCPIHGSHFAQSFGASQCPFWGSGAYPAAWDTVASTQPNNLMDEGALTAEEYDLVELQLHVGRTPDPGSGRPEQDSALLAARPVDFGEVMPGRTGNLSVPGDDIYPQATSKPGSVEIVRNEGNVPLGPIDLDLTTQLLRTETEEEGVVTLGVLQQEAPVNTREVPLSGPPGGGAMTFAHTLAPTPPTGFGIMPAYAGDVVGDTTPYVAGAPAAPGPDYAQVGAGGVPVPSGTPPGEYAGDFAVTVAGATLPVGVPARMRVTESRMPMDNLTAMDSTPTGSLPLATSPPLPGARSALVINWASNPPGGADVAQNIYEVVAAAAPPSPNDIFYGEKNWPAPPPTAITSDGAAPDLFYNQWPQMFFDPMNVGDVWGVWHTRRKSGATGMWNAFIRYRHTGMAGAAALLDTKQNKGGVRGLILNAGASADGAANNGRPWFFWEAGEQGRQRVGVNAAMTLLGSGLIDPASVDDFPLALTNGRRASGEPATYSYLDRASGAVWNLRKPDGNPFAYTKDPWVVETFWQDPVTASTRSYINVFYSAFLREHGNADICSSRFIPFADGAAPGDPSQITDPSANYGKAPYWRISGAYMGRRVLRKSTVFTGSLGEPMTPDGSRQSFTSRHLDWVIDQWYPMPNDPDMGGYYNWLAANVPGNTYAGQPYDPRIYVVLVTNPAAGAPADMDNANTWGLAPGNVEPLRWDPRDINGNYYDKRRGLIRITPINLPPDPVTGEPVYILIDPSSGAVRFSRHLYTQTMPDDPTAVFNTVNVPNLQSVDVWLDYQPYTFRLTTDGSQDDSPAVLFDPFYRITVFWRRMNSMTGVAHRGATSFLHKTFSTSIQVQQPPITGGPPTIITGGIPAPTQVWTNDGVLYWSPADLQAAGISVPTAVHVRYNGGVEEVHTIVGWSKEDVIPLDTIVAEGPISVAQEWYRLDVPQPAGPAVTTDFIKYWLFWTSNRGIYDPTGGALSVTGASDVYYTGVAAPYHMAVPE